MLVGIQGSGKTTFANQLAKELQCEIVSTDLVRSSCPSIKETEVWPMVYEKCAQFLKENKDVIFDATSITPNVRSRFVNEVSKYEVDVLIGVYYLKTDIRLCYERVVQRNKQNGALYLPPEVVYSYNEKLIPPTLDEGFAFIRIIENGKIMEEIKK